MTKPTTAEEAIVYNAIGPKKIKVDGTEVEEFTPAELLPAADRAAANIAGNRTHQGVRFVGLTHPGTG
jgi:hypothetical protein